MDVSSHCMFSILTVSQFSENRKAGKAVQLTLAVTAQRESLLESWACLLFTLTAIPICLLLFSIFPLNIFEYGCECDAHNNSSGKLLWSSWRSTNWTLLSPTLLKCPWARHWINASLQSHWSWPLPPLDEGKWKEKFPTCINPSSGKRIWLNCPFKFESFYVSGWTSSPEFLPSLCACCGC